MENVAPFKESEETTKKDPILDYEDSQKEDDSSVMEQTDDDGYDHTWDKTMSEEMDTYLVERKLDDVPQIAPMELGNVDPEQVFLHEERVAFYTKFGGGYGKLARWPLPRWINSIKLGDRYMDWLHAVRNYDGLESLEKMLDNSDVAKRACELLLKNLEKFPDDTALTGSLPYWMEHVFRIEEEAAERDRLRKEKDERVKDVQPAKSTSANPATLSSSTPGTSQQQPSTPAVNYRTFEQKRDELSQQVGWMDQDVEAASTATINLLRDRKVDITGGLKPLNALRWTTKLSQPFNHFTACKICGDREHLDDKCKLGKTTSVPMDTSEVTVEEQSIEAMLRKLRNESCSTPTATNSQLKCAYRLCTKQGNHVTAACQLLHNRCSQCGYRGHDSDTTFHGKKVCPKTEPAERSLEIGEAMLGALFEEVADIGTFTKQRKVEVAAGFHRIRGNTEGHIASFIGYDELAKANTAGVNQCLEDMVGLLQKHFPRCPRFSPSPVTEQRTFDEYVTKTSNAIRAEEDVRRRQVELLYNARESFHLMGKKTVGTLRDMVRKEKVKYHEAFVKAFTSARTFLEKPERRISGREPLQTRTDFVKFFSEEIILAVRPPKGDKGQQSGVTLPTDADTAPPPITAPSSPYAAAVGRPTPAGETPSTSTSMPPPDAPPAKRPVSNDGHQSSSPAPKRQDSRRLSSLWGFRKQDAVKDRAYYRAVKAYVDGIDDMPEDHVLRRVSEQEVHAMEPVAHEILEKASMDKMDWKEDELPSLTKSQLSSFPRNMVFWPKLNDREVWGKTRYEEGDVVYVAGGFWYVWDEDGDVYTYRRFDPARGRPRGQDRSRSGNRRGSRGNYSGYQYHRRY